MNQEELQQEIAKQLANPMIIYAMLAILAVRIIVWLLMANTIRKTLLLVSKENQCLRPNQAFGIAIPLFNIFWNFEVAKQLRDSLNNEFFDRKIAVEENPTFKKGMLYFWIFLACNIPFLPPFISVLAVIFHILTLINYWVNIVSYKRILEEHNKFRSTEEFKEI